MALNTQPSIGLETLDGCPTRPGFGTSGKAIKVFANMFAARFDKSNAVVYHYDIEIDPVVKTKEVKSQGLFSRRSGIKWSRKPLAP